MRPATVNLGLERLTWAMGGYDVEAEMYSKRTMIWGLYLITEQCKIAVCLM